MTSWILNINCNTWIHVYVQHHNKISNALKINFIVSLDEKPTPKQEWNKAVTNGAHIDISELLCLEPKT